MDKKIEKDNIFSEHLEDLTVCSCNVSENLRNNPNKSLIAAKTFQKLEEKRIRNQKYKMQQKINGILKFIVIIGFIVFVSLLVYAFLQKDNEQFDRAMAYCQSQGHSRSYCEKGWGI